MLTVVKNTLVLTSEILNPLCFGNANGSIEVMVDGGEEPYTYEWSNGSMTWNPSGLSAGMYMVTITDANGCTTGASFMLDQPDSLVIALVTDTVTCALNDGAANLTVTGGTQAYNYSWTGPNSFTSTNEDLAGLNAGSYVVTVEDANGCAATESFTLLMPDCPGITDSCDIKVYSVPGADGPRVVVQNLTLTGELTYEVFTVTGERVASGSLGDISPGFTFDGIVEMPGLQSGMYCIHFHVGVWHTGAKFTISN